ncbi:MAG: O-antigen ligase family protein [bacterium]|nr:O-antigen ligase family protein [bacterium]
MTVHGSLMGSSAESWRGTGSSPVPGTYPRYVQAPMLVFLVFLAFVVVRYVAANDRMDLLSTIRFEFLLGAASIVLAIIQLSARKPEIGSARVLLIAIVLLFFCMILELPLAADPVEARRVFIDRAFKFAMLTFLLMVFVESPRYMQLFLWAFLFSIFYITLESVQGLISGGLYWQNQGVMRLHGAVPMYGHPNSLGGVSLGALPFVFYLWSEMKRWYLRAGLLALAGTASTCVVYSGSRTAYVGIIGLIMWMFYQSKRKGRFLLVVLVFGALFVAVLPKQYIERFESIGGQEKEGNSKLARIQILRDAWTILLENPLGVGVASFPAKRTQRFGRSQDTHNLYLEVATNLGVQGFVVFCVMVASMFATLRRATLDFGAQRRRLLRIARRGPPRGVRVAMARHDRDLGLLIAVSRATGGFIFVRLVLGAFGMDLYEIYWWFGAGIAVALSGMAVTTARRTDFFDAAMSDDLPQGGPTPS